MRFLPVLLLTSVFARAALDPAQAENVRALLRSHQLGQAESAANALVAANPSEPEAYLLVGNINVAQGDVDDAVKAFEKATKLAPQNSEYQRELGDACGLAAQKAGMFSMLGWAKKCRLAYEKSVELDPANLNSRYSLMVFYQQAPGIAGGGMEKAYAQAAEIKKLDAARGRIAYATLYVGEKKFAEASAALEETLKTNPDDYAALYQVGKLAAVSGDNLNRGIAALKKCLTLPPPAGTPGYDAANWRLGNVWEKKGDKAAARAAYQAALAVNPNFQQATDALKKLR